MSASRTVHLKWKAFISLIIIYLAVFYDIWWLWGALLLCWGVNDLIRGHTWLTETVSRQTDPVLYFAIVASWLVWGCYLILLSIH